MEEIRIREDFMKACPPLSPTEVKKLEDLIIKDGAVYHPILIWDNIVVDGHNRFRIAKEFNIPFTTKEIMFNSNADAIAWIKENALGQRNLNDYQKSVLVLELEHYYKEEAKQRQIRKPESVVQNSAPQKDKGKVRDKLAQKAGVSHDTISKVKTIEREATPEVKEKLRRGETTGSTSN